MALGDPAGFPDAARAAFEDGPEVVFDTTGQWLEPAVHALGRFGRLAVIAAPPGDHARLPVLALYRKGGSVVGINSLLYDTRACAKMLARLGAAFDDASLPAPAAPAVVPLERGLEAYREVNGGRSDKIVFTMGAPG